MKFNFDLDDVVHTEFGIGIDVETRQEFILIPVDASVQKALIEMTQVTWATMQKDDDGPKMYEPSEKHESIEYLYLPLDSSLAASVRQLHEAANLLMNSYALGNPAAVFCYFARLIDKDNRQLTALKRATQFKGILKSRLLRIVTDSLRLIEDRVFKLDTDFDLLIDSTHVYILRPSGFEFAGKLQRAIMEAVPDNIAVIGNDLPFVDFNNIQTYALGRIRAARYLASIRGQAWTKNIDQIKLKNFCKRNGVEVTETNGKISVVSGHEMGFLEILDRRRYEIEFVKDQPERFKAASRRKLNG